MNWIVIIFLSCPSYIFGHNRIHISRRIREQEEERQRTVAWEIIMSGHPMSDSMHKTFHRLRHSNLEWEDEDTSVDILPWWQEKERDSHADSEESVRSHHSC